MCIIPYQVCINEFSIIQREVFHLQFTWVLATNFKIYGMAFRGGTSRSVDFYPLRLDGNLHLIG